MYTADSLESDVRTYCRTISATFCKASGDFLIDVHGNKYIDFLAGCGSLNYGHNHEVLRTALLDYIKDQGITMSMDLRTSSKERFLHAFHDHVLRPRRMEYKLQFTGPTGTNAVEAAIKLARKVTGRTNIITFTNAFHGCSLGALSLTGSHHHRAASVPLLTNVTRMPYDGYLGSNLDTVDFIDRLLSDPSSGVDAPAAIILETVQGEGGLNVATRPWLQQLQRIARTNGALLIVDDIQTGCGRTTDFFSFESSGIVPDIICLAKSISGFGQPMGLILVAPEYDAWRPGEHNGTFRGPNYSFVTACAAIETFWKDDAFSDHLKKKASNLKGRLCEIVEPYGLPVKGRGLMLGIAFPDANAAENVKDACYRANMIVETSGPHAEVVKLLPPLTVCESTIDAALDIISEVLTNVHAAGESSPQPSVDSSFMVNEASAP